MNRYKDFADLVDRMAADAPERAALLACDATGAPQAIAWRELAERVHARSAELASQGCLCEAILADGTPACVVEAFAAVRAGLQVALIDPLIPNQMMSLLLHAVDADCVWASDTARQRELEAARTELARLRGVDARLAKEKDINRVVFDRNGYLYHGRIKAVADGAREGGLEF